VNTDSPHGSAEAMGSGIPAAVARRIRLVILDVDGVLTDAGVWLGGGAGSDRIELKRFDIQDGLGLRLLQDEGITVALVSGRPSEATTLRARELGIEECHQDAGARKLPVVRALLERRGVDWEEVAMVGDDLPDIPVLERVGLPVAVANAVPEVRARARWITSLQGGSGAVREFAEALLQARDTWDNRVEAYLDARRDDA
jgi:3-deoxy-D-manno-octulosonate 8-phosphate phosphatase (KDO 8-P phosphatase)